MSNRTYEKVVKFIVTLIVCLFVCLILTGALAYCLAWTIHFFTGMEFNKDLWLASFAILLVSRYVFDSPIKSNLSYSWDDDSK